ncbi:DUF4440 domain-containing protein [Raoultella terrigena]|jgi:hypothetical protein|uniref:Cytoplasmic protein n=1 Tax=Raoultella terrigena TaxID=577 RepID=A0A7Z8Z8K0_RAOTE|nr:DUF4440 domain-containing protein [Raoultella terrigena]VUD31039.1 putative cytoplasmic protein [Raoultella sp. NCTC 9187]MCE9898394.1 DUF4440 domain-containing protein [Raoultella terrigena]MEB7601180.1 DUF4440 domain-containing protein [Raoultella terrigena]MEB8194818.1 DUF4440 domain-containing protein [Raoultella terrigena]QIT27405.1 DUF4440 domain-containing protein [Raoultella terrigena]
MSAYFEEVIDAHVVIENWLGRKEGSAEALMARFTPDFTLVATGGARMDHPTVSHFFQQAGGSRAGLTIAIDSLTELARWHDGAAVLYRETQTLPGQTPTVRWSTVVFRQEDERILWRHLQETWQG